ncbi:hypothetical protein ACSOTD_03720 [Acinetobacter baumannii]
MALFMEYIYPSILLIAFSIRFTLKFIRERRWQQDDDQYIP